MGTLLCTIVCVLVLDASSVLLLLPVAVPDAQLDVEKVVVLFRVCAQNRILQPLGATRAQPPVRPQAPEGSLDRAPW